MVSNSVGLIFGTCRCSTDEQSIAYNNEVIVEKRCVLYLVREGNTG